MWLLSKFWTIKKTSAGSELLLVLFGGLLKDVEAVIDGSMEKMMHCLLGIGSAL